jgi:succinoglycan biosynthesis protein ExoO
VKQDNDRDIVVIIKQRITGSNNGSSAYLLAICKYLSEHGRKVSLLWPNPATFGRWPFLRLSPDLDFANEMKWRGGIRIGNYVFCTNPKVYYRAVLASIEALLLKTRIVKAPFLERAKSALLSQVSEKDVNFIKLNSSGAKAVLLDYAFSVDYLNSVAGNNIPSAVVMHDLFSSRGEQFANTVVKDDYGHLTYDQEIRLLGKPGAVIAIQKDEAEVIRADLPGQKIIVSPMSVQVKEKSNSTADNVVFFVGSGAAPNVIGVTWFLEHVWPLVLLERPDAILNIVGTVCRNIYESHPNVKLHGPVDSLKPYYDEATAVISPLTTGSGLKIKLIEGMAYGKAIVATTVTLQGVADVVTDAVIKADEEKEFANGVLKILNEPHHRQQLERSARDCVEANFSADACFLGILDHFGGNIETNR